MRKLLVALAATGCVHASSAPTRRSLASGEEAEAYLAADEVRTLSLESTGEPLVLTCSMTGEGSYARVEIHGATDVLARGTCGDRIVLRNAPAGALSVAVRAYGGPGLLRVAAGPLEEQVVEASSGDPPEGALSAALKRRDEAALDALLMDDFTARLGGASLDKRAFLDAVRREPAPEGDPTDIRFRVHGLTAIATFAQGSTVITDTWVSDGGRWRLLARQR